MIDLHSHILPCIDDGARNMQDSLDMAQQAIDVGVTAMVCTPHIHQGYFDNDESTISSAFTAFKEELNNNAIDLKIARAAEIRLSADIPLWIKANSLPFIGKWQGQSAFMLELPHSHIPPGTENLLRWLKNNNIQPIIVHPERNRDVLANYQKILFLKRAGAIFQVTAGAFTGCFSDAVQFVAEQMLNEDLIALVASDTHNTERRANEMGNCRDRLRELAGQSVAKKLTFDAPQKITEELEWF